MDPSRTHMSSYSHLMMAIRAQGGKPVPFYYYSDEETCEHCDKVFKTPVECGAHEKACKAKTVMYVKQTSNKKSKKDKDAVVCHICGSSSHLPVKCPVSRHMHD